jgi:cytoskeletal protein CcmA (bactofilin family)
MFTKKPVEDAPLADSDERTTSPAANRSARARRGNGQASMASMASMASIIGPDLVITGNLHSEGQVDIEGEVQGDVEARRIVVGERAQIVGALIADEVVVRGGVQGQIRGNSVTFQATSRVEGDIFHKSLLIEQGALFEGRSRRSNDPLSVGRGANGLPPPIRDSGRAGGRDPA